MENSDKWPAISNTRFKENERESDPLVKGELKETTKYICWNGLYHDLNNIAYTCTHTGTYTLFFLIFFKFLFF